MKWNICILALFLLFQNKAFAAPWKIIASKKVISEIEPLIDAYSEINSEDELLNLVEEIEEKVPHSVIYPFFNGAEWVIEVKEQKIISSIKVDAVAVYISRQIEKSLADFRGQDYTPATLGKIIDISKATMKELGFPEAAIFAEPKLEENMYQIEISLKTGRKCTIKKVSYNFAIRDDIDPPMIKGEICNENKMLQLAESFRRTLKDEGYAFSSIKFEGIKFEDGIFDGHAIFTGNIGNKIEYRIKDKSTTLSFSDLIPDFKQSLSPADFSPISVRTELINRYRESGYLDVVVAEPRKFIEEDNLEVYEFSIYPGEKTNITGVQIAGTKFINLERAKEILLDDTSWSLSNQITFEKIETGIKALRNFYIDNGFWDVQILPPRYVKRPQTQETTVSITVEEGVQRFLKAVEIKGNQFFKKEELVSGISGNIGKAINRVALVDFEKSIANKYFESGFLYSTVKLEIKSKDNRRFRSSTVILNIEEGQRVTFGRVLITGLLKTKQRIVSRSITFKSGTIYSPEKIRESKRNLINIGIFRSVTIEPTDKDQITRKASTIDISIILRESDAGLISFGPGYDIFNGYNFVVEGSYKNISGMARRFSFRGQISEDKQQEAVKSSQLLGTNVGVGFIEPYFFRSNISGRLSLSHKATASSFWNFSTIGQEELSYNLDFLQKSYISMFARQKINTEVGTNSQIALYLSEGDTNINSFGGKVEVDLRNDIGWPSKGYLISLESEKSDYWLGGNVRFDKISATANMYLPLFTNLVVATSFQYSQFRNINRNDKEPGFNTLPASESLFAGGSELVRGYNKQLGPFLRYTETDETGTTSQRQVVLGGTERFINKLELRYLLSENSALSLFHDSGNAFISPGEIDKMKTRFIKEATGETLPTVEENYPFDPQSIVFDPDKYLELVYTSLGIAYNYLTPLGSFRIGFAYPLKQPNGCNDIQCAQEGALDRRNQSVGFFNRGKIDISIAAKF